MDPLQPRFVSQYSPEFQLELLGLVPKTLAGPVLDLGCGEAGSLVLHLRQQGVEAFGVDLAAPRGGFFFRADWLTWPLARGAWGTVISHMGLSSHFLRHHLHPEGNPQRHARRYMEVLASLKPEGSFVYAPGLPFLERLLPGDRYQVATRPVDALSGGDVESYLQGKVGENVLYACQVRRLP